MKKITSFFTSSRQKIITLARRKPFAAFLTLLAILLVLIAASNLLQRPKVQKEQVVHAPKPIKVFTVGTSPVATMQAKIEKTGSITILAQSAGIVREINVKEGKTVKKGANLVQLASNYAGANVFALQRAIAQKQYENTKSTFDAQKEILAKNKEIAETSESNSGELREITRKTLEDTRNLIRLNEDIVATLDKTIRDQEAAGATSKDLLPLKQQKSQFESGLLQLRQGLSQAEYAGSDTKPPADLARLQKEVAIKSIELQEKGLALGLEISRLQLQLAYVQESQYHPTAPFAGVVEKVFVKPADAVQPGTPLLTLTGNANATAKATVYVTQNVAEQVSTSLESAFYIDGNEYKARPLHVSTAPVKGSLYAITYILPLLAGNNVDSEEYVQVSIPLTGQTTSAIAPLVPIDAVYQTQGKSYIFVVNNGKASTLPVEVRGITGAFALLEGRVEQGTQIITTRGVIEGEQVVIE